jgi:hypothetical protein
MEIQERTRRRDHPRRGPANADGTMWALKGRRFLRSAGDSIELLLALTREMNRAFEGLSVFFCQTDRIHATIEWRNSSNLMHPSQWDSITTINEAVGCELNRC